MNCSLACASAGSEIAVRPTAAAARAKVNFNMFPSPVRPANGRHPEAIVLVLVHRVASPARPHHETKPRPSIGVRPEPKLLLAGGPKSSKAMGFDDQEPADQRPCDNEDQERHGFDRDRDAE